MREMETTIPGICSADLGGRVAGESVTICCAPSAPPLRVDGSCGSAEGSYAGRVGDPPPSTNLCDAGNPTTPLLNGVRFWEWRCEGSGGGSFDECAADITPPATCSDSRQNGDETDVDCGGSCPRCGGSGNSCVYYQNTYWDEGTDRNGNWIGCSKYCANNQPGVIYAGTPFYDSATIPHGGQLSIEARDTGYNGTLVIDCNNGRATINSATTCTPRPCGNPAN